ncbi:RCC1/BLIP-II, partial [Cryphonectria parasitica EP155]
PGQELPALQDCVQVVAYDAGFAALTSTGSVYTWGDERYMPCLARDLDEFSPSDKPGLVHSLQDLPTGPITKIAAGGYILAALTKGNDLYVWGGHLGKRTLPVDLVGGPTPMDIDDHDIADVAVGDAHLIVLTTHGHVFVIGDNRNGQLGIKSQRADVWEEVELDLSDKTTPVAVVAGPRGSFITVERLPHSSGI